MIMTYRIGYWRARGRYEVGYFALKRASPAEQPRELIDRTSMSAPSSAQQDIRGACENARARIVRAPLRETGLPGRETGSCGDSPRLRMRCLSIRPTLVLSAQSGGPDHSTFSKNR